MLRMLRLMLVDGGLIALVAVRRILLGRGWCELLMSKGKARVAKRSLVKGMLAGLAGGLAAVAAKGVADKFFPEHAHGGRADAAVAEIPRSGAFVGGCGRTGDCGVAPLGVWGAGGGGLWGGGGVLPCCDGEGRGDFGLTLATISSRLAGAAEEQTTKDKTSAMATHVVYGLVTETVRRFVRKRLG